MCAALHILRIGVSDIYGEAVGEPPGQSGLQGVISIPVRGLKGSNCARDAILVQWQAGCAASNRGVVEVNRSVLVNDMGANITNLADKPSEATLHIQVIGLNVATAKVLLATVFTLPAPKGIATFPWLSATGLGMVGNPVASVVLAAQIGLAPL